MNNNKPQNIPLTILIVTLGIGTFFTIFNVLNSKQNPAVETKTEDSAKPTESSSSQSASSAQPLVPPQSQTSKTPEVIIPPTIVTPKTVYKDGTYSSALSYRVPKGGVNQMEVTLTVATDNVSSVIINNTYSDRESGNYDSLFKRSYKSQVIGKKLNSVKDAYVSNATLTSDAFDEAVNKIISQAQ
jgi:uncharacterized protein with FMN-binding domain